MSRPTAPSPPLLVLAFAVLAVAGLAPVVAMLLRIEPQDLAGVLDERTRSLLGRTVALGLSSAAIAVALGAPFGWLTARTDVPGAALLRPLGVVPLLLPPLFLAVAWTGLVEARGAGLTAWILGVGTMPLVALFTAKAAERVDQRREDAARLAGGLGAALRMELPLLAPGVACGACLAFVFTVNDFAVPDYVTSVGPKFNVYADEVFASWRADSRVGPAVAKALPLIALTLLTLLPALALRRRGTLATLEGDFTRPAPLRLGAWRWPALAFCLAVVAAGTLLPLGRLLWESGGGPRGFRVEAMTAAFGTALERGRENLGNSLRWSAAAALVAAPLGLVLGHALERARGGRWLELLVVVPVGAPAVLLGIGYIGLWNTAATADVYDSGALVVLLFLGRYLPFAVLVASGATASLDRRLEEAAALAGAGPERRLAQVVGPALVPSLWGAAALVFVLSMRELDAAILLPAANGTIIFRCFNAIHFGRDDFVAALCLLVVFFTVLPGLLWSLFARRRMEVLP